MTITAVRPVKKGLALLYIDGEAAVRIDREVLLLEGIKAGMILSDDRLRDLIQKSDLRRAQEKALYLLERRSHSKKELTDKIAAVSPREAAQAAARRMEEIGLVDDAEFARQFARDRFLRKKLGLRRVRQELYQKGIDKDLAEAAIQELLEENEVDQSAQVRQILQRKYPLWQQDEKVRRRAVAALQRMGYGWDDIRGAMQGIEEDFSE